MVLPSYDIVACEPNIVDCINPEKVNEKPKVDVVAFAHTIGDKRTVVVKKLHTNIAGTTMHRALWSDDHA